MIADSSSATTPSEPSEPEIDSIAAYARYRLSKLCRDPVARGEVALVIGLLALVFGPSLLSWWRRWTLPNSLQGYAVWVPPLTLAWLWLNRQRVIVPELDALNERFTERSVLRFLLEEKPEPPKRLPWLLALGVVGTLLAVWIGEPALTCMAFILLVTGILGYRHGTLALRVLAFPLLFLVTMIPLPAIPLDWVTLRLQNLLFKLGAHLLSILGLPAELDIYINPINIGVKEETVRIWAGLTGTGYAEAGLCLLLMIWYLSLLHAPFRKKLGGLFWGMIWVGALLVLRLTLLGWLGWLDRDLIPILAPLTRWLIVIAGVAGQLRILRGLRCREYQEWVSV